MTSSERQVELAIEYEAAAILTTGDYLLRLADVARGRWATTPPPTSSSHAMPNIGDRELLESTFGVECFESYGFHEVQWVSVECPAHDGLHIFEDAFVVQVVDPETGEPLPDGELGALVRHRAVQDRAARSSGTTSWTCRPSYPREQCSCGSWLRKMAPFAGRGDNMVKLRGVNVWPEAVGELAMTVDGVAPDWFVRAVRRDGRDELIVSVVSERDPSTCDGDRRRGRAAAQGAARRADRGRGGPAGRARRVDRGRRAPRS